MTTLLKIGIGKHRAQRIVELLNRFEKHCITHEERKDVQDLKQRLIDGISEMESYN